MLKPVKPSSEEAVPSTEQKPDLLPHWKKELQRAEKYFSDKFWPMADKLYKKYAKLEDASKTKRQFAMLWANTEVLKPAVYARPPVPQVSRRYKDRDPIGRLAAEMLERATSYEFERTNVDSPLRAVRDDMLLPGRGQAWVRYEADIEDVPGPDGQPTEQVTDHRVVVDYIHYRQFLHQPARRWEEVGWVAKISYMDAEEGRERFGEAWKGVELDNKPDSSSSEDAKDPALINAQEGKATIYEIWSKRHKKVFFIAKSCDHILAEDDPLLDLEGFFPCPKPVFSTLTNNSLIPTPDYKYYQDQAEEIDDLTDRIDKLTDSLKLVGFYPAGAEGDVSEALARALSPSVQNQMIPIASWAAFGERGGSNAIIWLPIKDVVETIRACVELRNQLVQDTYQITGISDILRGATESDETATAQSIKAQWGSIRIRDRQQEMVRFARDLTRIAVEIIAEQFDGEFVLQMANMERPQPPQQPQLPPMQPTGDPEQDQQMMQQAQEVMQQYQAQLQEAQEANAKIDQALALIKDQRARGFRIDIETDSTIQPDEDAEKQRRTEFVTAMGGLLQQAMPLVMQVPELEPMISETLLFTARGFRAGRQLEDQIEQAMQAVRQKISAQQEQQPAQDPTLEKQAQKMQMEIEHTGQKNQLELQHIQAKNGLELENMQRKTAADIEVSQKRAQVEHAIMGERGELEVNQGKSKLRDQILAEEQEAFLGQPGEQVNGVAMVLQQTLDGLTQALTNSNAQVIASNQQLLTALTAPKVITAPDGRQYTAQTALN